LAVAFATDLVSICIFTVLMYFRRHTRRSLMIVFTYFNLGIFVVVAVIGRAEIQASVGFGLFAMLSIIRLRSDPFGHREMAYFFGSMVLGVLNAIGMPEYAFTLAMNAVLLAAMYLLDHPAIMYSTPRISVTMDAVITDPRRLRDSLEVRLGAPVREVTVQSVDFVRDTMDLRVQYAPPRPPSAGRAARRRRRASERPGLLPLPAPLTAPDRPPLRAPAPAPVSAAAPAPGAVPIPDPDPVAIPGLSLL
jgi:hypothetical protein